MRHSNSPTAELSLMWQSGARGGLLPRANYAVILPEFETPEAFIARMRAKKAAPVVRPRRRQFTPKRIVVGSAALACAVTMVTGIARPWQSPEAIATTPAILDFEFANARAIATAPGESATTTLLDLAQTASAAGKAQGVGGYQRVVTDNWFTTGETTGEGSKSVLVPQVNETYVYPDGRFRLIERRGTPLAPDGRGAPSRGDWEKLPTVIDEIHAAEATAPDVVDNFSTVPSVLRGQLLDHAGCGDQLGGLPDGLCLFSEVQALFTRYVVPHQVAAAMWTVLADVPEVRSLGAVTDRVGRKGVGVSLFDRDDLDKRWILVISPKSGQLLGTEQILLEPSEDINHTVPAILEFTAIITAERTEEPPSEARSKRF